MIETRIDELIAASSVGAGLADIKERGIDAHLVDLEAELATAKKRTKSTSPTQRTLAECRKRGYVVQVVERWNQHARVRVDLFGVIDLVAIAPAFEGQHPGSDHGGDGPCAACSSPSAILGIQACAAASHAARRDKILAEPRAKQWVEAGGWLELWSWSKRGGAGKRKLWTLRIETYAEMIAAIGART